MCGRYTNTAGVQELNERFKVPFPGEQGTHRYNIAPSEEVLAIVSPKGEPEARLLRWGLIPPWANDLKGSYKMINAKLETVTARPAYRSLVAKGSRRALQIADGYYEWLKPERRDAPRQPFLFRVDGGVPFAFAALWTPAKIDGEWVHSVVLLTCDSAPNRVAAAIHDRMPVVLADGAAQQAWLDDGLDAEEALALCGALAESRLSALAGQPGRQQARSGRRGPGAAARAGLTERWLWPRLAGQADGRRYLRVFGQRSSRPEFDERERVAMGRARAHPEIVGQLDDSALAAVGAEAGEQREAAQQRARQARVVGVAGEVTAARAASLRA